ncbi:hypothetical protein NQ318_019928 [Aromia moschata]|uniref:Uncharacterized protein n=1 Tax=Aromia moschata TaxID=1265417 RepID=A0AAV8Y9S2_9CUCU|nr:hypothetical protein NQ318_019928 [Aromia moschata]
MQKSFSIVEDDDDDDDVFIKEHSLTKEDKNKTPYKVDLSDSESEENENSPKKDKSNSQRGPSGRQTVLRKKQTNDGKFVGISSDSEDSDNEEKGKVVIPGEYDPKQYEKLGRRR